MFRALMCCGLRGLLRLVGHPNHELMNAQSPQELGRALDHLAVSAQKFETSVVGFFAQEEDSEKFSPLAQRAG